MTNHDSTSLTNQIANTPTQSHSDIRAEFELKLNQYWDLAFAEGRTKISQGDKANKVLSELRELWQASRQSDDVRKDAERWECLMDYIGVTPREGGSQFYISIGLKVPDENFTLTPSKQITEAIDAAREGE